MSQPTKKRIIPERLFPIGLIFIIDIVLTGISFALSYWICAKIFPEINEHNLIIQLPIVIAISSLIFLLIGIYRGLVRFDKLKEVYSIFNAICLANILTIIFAVVNAKLNFEENFSIPLSIILVHSVVSFGALLLARQLYKSVLIGVKDWFVVSSNSLLLHDLDSNSSEFQKVVNSLKEANKNVIDSISLSEDLKKLVTPSFLEDNVIDDILIQVSFDNQKQFFSSLEQISKLSKPVFLVGKKEGKSGKQVYLEEIKLETILAPQLNIENSTNSIKKGLSAKKILVTGAGGSIATQFIQNLANLGIESNLLLLDNSESALNHITTYCEGISKFEFVSKLGDVKDSKLLKGIFKSYKPDIVLHTAGNNNPDVLDNNIINVLKENVFATKQLADLALDNNVDSFLFCSSISAELPGTTIEVSKRLSEIYLDTLNELSKKNIFTSIRFNKVFDSENSFVSYIKWQLESGRSIDLSSYELSKIFTNRQDVANTLIYCASSAKNLGGIVNSNLGMEINTELLINLIKIYSGEEYNQFNFKSKKKKAQFMNENYSSSLENKVFQKPPIEKVVISNTKSPEEIQQIIESLCLNIVLNTESYNEIFKLIQEFKPGQWQNLYNLRTKNVNQGGIIPLR
ncbi:nucleoside-diphosphate sugar epimerase [Croceivirga lutea]|uniref:polysaccharide biosynthesis protein n=1 Tax=Croceivirga lutea TaxID=1775167 RepID=UPI00163ADF28|nr:polysaccharide biosynthesis protein [Croceivirga lutea]GGG42587.1 nucleoside-diphosphate sugar epimerase [Croceivirga lutea]